MTRMPKCTPAQRKYITKEIDRCALQLHDDYQKFEERERAKSKESIQGNFRGVMTKEYWAIMDHLKYAHKLCRDLEEHARIQKEALQKLGVEL